MNNSAKKYRPDIDGLRAIAILSVVGYHAFPSLISGGFVGVDIFFVISGYLISSIIFSNLSHNTFSFVEFYTRRIKRIFPALILVLVACFAFGWFVLFADEYKQLGKHIVSGAAFVSNFALWGESSYFDGFAETKVLLHLWSLGVEEQFYIFWPVALWLVWKKQYSFLSLALTIAIASFSLNVAEIYIDPVGTFFLPQTRFWELMIGSVLALAQFDEHHLVKFKTRLNTFLAIYSSKQSLLRDGQSLLGVAMIAFSIIEIKKNYYYPGLWALLPTIGAALIIAAGKDAFLNRNFFSNRVLVWFGLISFPLYLWHWPLLSFARVIDGSTPGTLVRMGLALAAIVLAWLTYELIEKSIRFGKYGGAKTIALVSVMSFVAYIGYASYAHNGLMFREVALKHEIAARNISWDNADNSDETCHKQFPGYEYCKISEDRKPTVALIGDSLANGYFPGLAEQFNAKGENLVMLGRGGCPPLLDVASGHSGGMDWCKGDENTSDALRSILKDKNIHTVILAANWHLYINGTRFSDLSKGLPRWELRIVGNNNINDNALVFKLQMDKTVGLLKSNGKTVVVLKQVPELNYFPRTCISTRPFVISSDKCKSVDTQIETERKYLLEYEDHFDFPSKKYVVIWDPFEYFCYGGKCISKEGEAYLYRDDVHLSLAGSRYLGGKLASAISELN